MLWLRADSQRGIVRDHLAHVRGTFEEAGWPVWQGEEPPRPGTGPLAVMDDPWTEAFPELASRLAEAQDTGPTPRWRVPRVTGGPGLQGWSPRRGPYTLPEYRRRAMSGLRRRRTTPAPPDPWTGFAVAPAGAAAELLAAGWPPPGDRIALVTSARLYRYHDPADHERRELLPFVPERARRVVDVGCGHGGLGALLRRPGRTVVGIEPDWGMARAAARRLDLVLPGTAEQMLPAVPPPIDCVILADVLEHVAQPAAVLSAAAARLDADGVVVASFPNTAWAPVLRELAAGRWEPTLAGVQARDHLVPLTPGSLLRLAAECGLAPERLVPLPAPLSWPLRVWAWVAAKSAGGDPRDLSAPQWVAVLRPRRRG